MLDIHSHILPGIDDGAYDIDTTLEMLALAADSGVDGIVATSHCNIPGVYDNYADAQLFKLWSRVDEARHRAGIKIRMYRGMEIFATEELPRLLKEHRVWTLNGTRYFLTEFSFDEDPDFCSRILRECKTLGYQPIVAHPERYYFVQADPSIAYEWCTAGFGLQINKGSLLGRFGEAERELGLALLDHGLAACVASDAHSVNHRSTFMAEVRDFLTEEFGSDYTKLLLEENPRRILSGQGLVGYQPIPF